MIHSQNVANYAGTLPDLAEEVGDLRYDALAEFLRLLAAKVGADAAKDATRGRARLAAALGRCSVDLSAASSEIIEAWRISAPFMSAPPADEAPP